MECTSYKVPIQNRTLGLTACTINSLEYSCPVYNYIVQDNFLFVHNRYKWEFNVISVVKNLPVRLFFGIQGVCDISSIMKCMVTVDFYLNLNTNVNCILLHRHIINV